MPSKDVTITGTLTWEGRDWTPPDRPARPSRLALVQPEHLLYQGAFRVPPGLGYWGAGLGYNPARPSLLAADANNQYVSEISTPEPVVSAGNLAELPVATLLHPPVDVTCGLLAQISAEVNMPATINGLLPWNGELLIGAAVSYDANGTARLSHMIGSLDLSAPAARGPYEVGDQGAGSIGGYFGIVPIPWRRPLGGPVLNGWIAPSIVTRTSSGPTAFAIDPADIGVVQPYAHAEPLAYYPSNTGELYAWGADNAPNPLFNECSHVGGIAVCPAGTRSILFFGDTGLGPYCYDTGAVCGDDADASKGPHRQPYVPYVWAYDAWHLAAVQRGVAVCYDIEPYAYWQLQWPFGSWGRTSLLGAAHDAVSGRIWCVQKRAGGDDSVVHVYAVNTSALRARGRIKAGGCRC